MADELPGWARVTIDRMNDEPERARRLFSMAAWPPIGEVFEVQASGTCSTCGDPTIEVVERGDGDVPVALVTSGCLICDVVQVVDVDEIDLVEHDEIPGEEGSSADEDAGEPR